MENLKMGNLFTVNSARSSGYHAMTDISGYGLSSHLVDICLSSNLSSELIINKNILINSNLDLLKLFKSTGFDNNYKSTNEFIEVSENHPLENILYDPQTNGPMLMAIEKKNKEKFENFFINKLGNKPILIGKFINKLEKVIYVNEWIKFKFQKC